MWISGDPTKVKKTGDEMSGNLRIEKFHGAFISDIILTNGINDKADAVGYFVFNSPGVGDRCAVNNLSVFFSVQKTTATAPAYVKGGLYFDLTLNKLMVGGASAWETVTSS